eukprot:TRINITY_DN7821_c0_g1_i6.p1 TRINITY_DN7821_c0_g1~~TRINITY_DN7821_c0_g1_i6.p1  ORF type:complete len:349 (+),score=-13.56 TRINITY_DN7821_c0_g1_i6:1070-2116(+)
MKLLSYNQLLNHNTYKYKNINQFILSYQVFSFQISHQLPTDKFSTKGLSFEFIQTNNTITIPHFWRVVHCQLLQTKYSQTNMYKMYKMCTNVLNQPYVTNLKINTSLAHKQTNIINMCNMQNINPLKQYSSVYIIHKNNFFIFKITTATCTCTTCIPFCHIKQSQKRRHISYIKIHHLHSLPQIYQITNVSNKQILFFYLNTNQVQKVQQTSNRTKIKHIQYYKSCSNTIYYTTILQCKYRQTPEDLIKTKVFTSLDIPPNITMWAGVPSEPLCLHTQSLATAQHHPHTRIITQIQDINTKMPIQQQIQMPDPQSKFKELATNCEDFTNSKLRHLDSAQNGNCYYCIL